VFASNPEPKTANLIRFGEYAGDTAGDAGDGDEYTTGGNAA
jgi:hypothetical protein